MKSLKRTLASSAVCLTLLSSPSSDAAFSFFDGFYAMGLFGSVFNNGETLAKNASGTTLATIQTGGKGFGLGVGGGWGKVFSSVYVGGELTMALTTGRIEIIKSDNPIYKLIQQHKTGLGIAFRAGLLLTLKSLLFMRLGLDFGKSTFGATNATKEIQKNGIEPEIGMGVEIAASERFSIRAEYLTRFAREVKIGVNTSNNGIIPNGVSSFSIKPSNSVARMGVLFRF